MRVTLFKTKPDAQISLTDPNGTHLSQASPQVQINGSASAIESWTVADPAPGQWQVNVDKQENILSAYVDLILDAWNRPDAPPPLPYVAGTWGPEEADALMSGESRWRRL